jgi:hypothetical protein
LSCRKADLPHSHKGVHTTPPLDIKFPHSSRVSLQRSLRLSSAETMPLELLGYPASATFVSGIGTITGFGNLRPQQPHSLSVSRLCNSPPQTVHTEMCPFSGTSTPQNRQAIIVVFISELYHTYRSFVLQLLRLPHGLSGFRIGRSALRI